MKQGQSVDDYVAGVSYWRKELELLRKVLLSTELEENVKWGGPCYTIDGRNVVGMLSFKSYFGLWFFQGALLKDEKRVLINAQRGKTKALRQWRMTSEEEIRPATIKSYANEAIELARDDRAIAADRTKPVVVPPELKKALRDNKVAGNSFKKLRRGLQREYTDYIADARREDTKIRRVERILPMILAGVGLNDKYR